MFTLMQRMINDDEIGMNYDAMGYSEYEWGATLLPRTLISLEDAIVMTDLKMVVSTINRKRTIDIEVIVPGCVHRVLPELVQKVMKHLSTDTYRNKGSIAYNHNFDDLLGWLMLDPLPLLIYKTSAKPNVEKFIAHGRKMMIDRNGSIDGFLGGYNDYEQFLGRLNRKLN